MSESIASFFLSLSLSYSFLSPAHFSLGSFIAHSPSFLRLILLFASSAETEGRVVCLLSLAFLPAPHPDLPPHSVHCMVGWQEKVNRGASFNYCFSHVFWLPVLLLVAAAGCRLLIQLSVLTCSSCSCCCWGPLLCPSLRPLSVSQLLLISTLNNAILFLLAESSG
ncbi:MAG: hypothetical protein JOS17DRAFT_249726 [Linnemannia elongata]|nr:MAG: hypothetical protein JOS17DRAFT_249726 [Linnemannia elongata]